MSVGYADTPTTKKGGGHYKVFETWQLFNHASNPVSTSTILMDGWKENNSNGDLKEKMKVISSHSKNSSNYISIY